MIPATCPCCESAGPMHKRGCTFFKDCPDECMDFDDMARLRDQIARLRLTDAERKALERQASWLASDESFACDMMRKDAATLRALLARHGGDK